MRTETWYFKQNAMSFFIGLMPVGKYVEYNHHPNFACECDVTCKDYFYLSSTSLPGGNQVDGLPPVASLMFNMAQIIFPVYLNAADVMV